MNVEDVMALPAKRRPARLDAAQYVLVRERRLASLAPADVAAWIAALDTLKVQLDTAPTVAAGPMRVAYETTCRDVGGIGIIHGLESEGGIEAVHDLTRRLLAD